MGPIPICLDPYKKRGDLETETPWKEDGRLQGKEKGLEQILPTQKESTLPTS